MKLYHTFLLAALVMFSAAVNAQSASEREMETASEVAVKTTTDAKATIITEAPEGYVAKSDDEIQAEMVEKAMEEGSLWGDAPAAKGAACSGKAMEGKACCSKKNAEAKAENKAACSGSAAKASGCCASKAKAAAKTDEPN